MFRSFHRIIRGREQPFRLLNHDFELVLQECGFLHKNFLTKSTEKKFDLSNIMAYFLIVFNTARIVLTMFITDASIGLTFCDIGILFGDARLLGSAGFLSSYISTTAILWAFSGINQQKSHSDWIWIYFVDQKIKDWTHDKGAWNGLRTAVNSIYISKALVMMGIFYPVNACLIFGLLFVPDIKVQRSLQIPIWILSQGGNYIFLRGVQITLFLLDSYCLITKFRLDQISYALMELKTRDSKFSEREINSILRGYLQIYRDTRKSNISLSIIVGSVYCSACTLTILMLFTALYSNASPGTKLVAVCITCGTTFLGIIGFNLAGRFSTLSVSLSFSLDRK